MYDKNIVMAGIVTYNPDIPLLKKNIAATLDVLEYIFIVDNGSKNIGDVHALIDSDGFSKKVKIKEFGENFGIAKALNVIMAKGEELGYLWVMTLDQDSLVPQNIISSNIDMLTEKNSNKLVGITAVIADRNESHLEIEREQGAKYTEIERAISSAFITSVPIWKKVGGFDEWMFIDMVDFEYCRRAGQSGYKTLRNNEVMLNHAIGNIKEVKFLGKWRAVMCHSAFRKYYFIRNLIYMSRKLYGKLVYRNLKQIVVMYVKVALYEDDKIAKFKSMNRGVRDGFKAEIPTYSRSG